MGQNWSTDWAQCSIHVVMYTVALKLRQKDKKMHLCLFMVQKLQTFATDSFFFLKSYYMYLLPKKNLSVANVCNFLYVHVSEANFWENNHFLQNFGLIFKKNYFYT